MSSEIDFSAIGDSDQPSPSIWGDCPRTLLLDKGLGKYVSKDFAGEDLTLPGLPLDADTGTTYVYNTTTTDAVDVAVTNTDNNAVAIFTRPLGTITKNSGQKVWGEARVALAALGDQALFVGLTTAAGATRDAVLDNPSNSAAAAPAAVSTLGFISVQAASAIGKLNVIYRKGSATVVTALSDATNSTKIPLASRANMVAATFVKLGVRFNGRDKIRFYVNGYVVATQTVDATVDQTSSYAFCVCFKVGSAAAGTFTTDFFRGASQTRS